jgi:hypothetical protein
MDSQLRWVLPLPKVSNTLIATILKSMEIIMCLGLKPIRMQHRLHLRENDTILEREVTLLLRAPIHVGKVVTFMVRGWFLLESA